jgi:DNA-damage-inducible protein J
MGVEGVSLMAQAMVNFRIDEDLKKSMEDVCKDMGLSTTAAFTIFATKVSKERRIPFDITADPDPFYSEANMNRIRAAIADVKAGRNMTEHELIEVDDE